MLTSPSAATSEATDMTIHEGISITDTVRLLLKKAEKRKNIKNRLITMPRTMPRTMPFDTTGQTVDSTETSLYHTITNPGRWKGKESRDKYLETDYFLLKKQENNL
jgi:hypothetical protein